MNRDDIEALKKDFAHLHNRLLDVEGRSFALEQVTGRLGTLVLCINEELKDVWDGMIDQMISAYRESLVGANENTTRLFTSAIETLETQRSLGQDVPAPFTVIQGGRDD
ncbi:hypothetical protein [Ochrobactrum soli]|nr:hypothetical protein [[Ochrobactrum] soli]